MNMLLAKGGLRIKKIVLIYRVRGNKSDNYIKETNMIIYIGFSKRTHKIIARILCRNFKHCAPMVITKNKCEIYQFTSHKKITVIKIQKRDIKILEQYGWKFIKYKINTIPQNAIKIQASTCVIFTKKFCGINKHAIQTPDSLFKHITSK